MSRQNDIRQYGMDVKDLDASPFEMIEMLRSRSKIHSYFRELTDEEKLEVNRYDLILLFNAQEFYDKLKLVHDFQHSNKPDDEWWWHLHDVVRAFNKRSFSISFADTHGDLMVNMI